MKKGLIVSSVVLLVLLLLFSLFANVRLILFSRASGGSGDYSPENSYLFASPLSSVANSTDKIRITVFVLNSQGRGVANTEVRLSKSPELVTDQINSLTDTYGRAIFDLTTRVPGQYPIEAIVGSQKVGEGITISFL